MEAKKPMTVAVTILAYVVTTFAVQGTSHFAINADHYASITIMRAEPIVPMGLTSMVIQGFIFAWLFPAFRRESRPILSGIAFSCTIGAFLASYIALGEAGKYAVPSIGSWIAVEVTAAAVQFVLFGLLLGLVHRRSIAAQPAYQGA